MRELEHSVLFIGDHQYYEGYCVLVAKIHAREPFELDAPVAQGMMRELLSCARAINAEFSPSKMNYSCLGNVVPHVHWHLIPRREDDPHRLSAPIFGPLDQPPLAAHRTRPVEAAKLATRIATRLR